MSKALITLFLATVSTLLINVVIILIQILNCYWNGDYFIVFGFPYRFCQYSQDLELRGGDLMNFLYDGILSFGIVFSITWLIRKAYWKRYSVSSSEEVIDSRDL